MTYQPGLAGTISRPFTYPSASGGAPVRVNLPVGKVTATAWPPTLPTQAQPGLVQETSNSTTGTTLTLTFAKPVTQYNAVILALGGYYSGVVNSIQIGGGSGPFVKQAVGGGYSAEIWADLYVTQTGATTVTITTTAAGIVGWAYEVAGAVPSTSWYSVALDKSAGTYGARVTSWASPATGQTIPGNEFVVGLGINLSTGTNTITGPSSGGWTNETAYNNVVGASGFHVSGVSGYQQQSGTPAAYSYGGTAASATAWSAVTATFLLMPQQTGWGGVTFNEHSSYTGVSAEFTIPTVSGPASSLASLWVGLGNVYQTGIYLSYDTTKSGNAATSCWSWWLNGAGELWKSSSYPTKAGDQLTMSIELTSTDWLMTLTNATEGWTYTEVKSVLGVNVGSLAPDGGALHGWAYPCTTAEIIIEKEGSYLTPNYGQLAFTKVTTTPPISREPGYIVTVNSGAIDQYPQPFSIPGQTFTMVWGGASSGSGAGLAITTTSLPGASTGTAYTAALSATGGTAPYTWSISSGSLPTGLSLNASTGAITGTPSAAGTISFTAEVTDSAGGAATQPLSIAVTTTGSWLFQTSAAEGTNYTATGTDGQTYLFSNNAWAPTAGPQTIYVNSNNDWKVVSSQVYETTYYVDTYPNISPQFSGSGGLGTKPLSSYKTITGTHNETGPGYGSSLQWEAAWQFYLSTDSSGANGWPFMIWVDIANVATGGTLTPVTIGGVNYLWSDPGGGTAGNHVLVVTKNMPSGTIDLLACLNWAATHASDPPSGGANAILSIAQFGWEIWGTGGVSETFTCSELTMVIN